MKLSELEIGKEYAVIPSWTYNSRSARDINLVAENDVLKATLISKRKYLYEAQKRSHSDTEFQLAPDGERSVGVLVSATNPNDNTTIYWTTRLADIIAIYADLEPRWQQEKLDYQKREAEEEIKRQKIQAHETKIQAEMERSRSSVQATARELLGQNAEVSVDTQGYQFDRKVVVTITLAEFEKLIELSYEGAQALKEMSSR